MWKKTGLAAALLPAPRLLALDEPFEATDPVAALTNRAILRRFVAAGGSVVLPSHTMTLGPTPGEPTHPRTTDARGSRTGAQGLLDRRDILAVLGPGH